MIRLKKGKWVITALCVLCLLLSGCGQQGVSDEGENIISIVTFQMSPSSEGVEEFLKGIANYDEESYGRFYNIVPKDISDTYGINIFKSDLTCDSHLVYDHHEYSLGTCFGGYGVTSFAIADVNEDGAFELYFTFSWGSGIHRSQVGYFDSASRETVIFEFQNWNAESILAEDSNHALCVCNVDWETGFHSESYVDIALSTGDKIASLALDNGEIALIQYRR